MLVRCHYDWARFQARFSTVDHGVTAVSLRFDYELARLFPVYGGDATIDHGGTTVAPRFDYELARLIPVHGGSATIDDGGTTVALRCHCG